jgi:hypothetical protein
MPKTQLQLANHAWRKATSDWPMSRKQHRDFCRSNAKVTVDSMAYMGEPPFEDHHEAYEAVLEELSEWHD